MADDSTDVWMPFYTRDYLGDTMHLSTEQHGAYLLLLLAYWIRQGPLPDDDTFLATTCRMTAREWRTHRPVIGNFFTIANGMWKQKRADLEIATAQANRARHRRGAAKTNAKRWGSRGTATQERVANESHSDRSATQERVAEHVEDESLNCRPSPSPSPKDIPPSPPTDLPESEAPTTVGGGRAAEALDLVRQAEAIWAEWPKRIDTLSGILAIRHAILRHGFDQVLEGTRKIVAADAQRKASPPGRYLPRPTEFFDGSRYLDDPGQYGPRDASPDVQTLRRELAEKRRALAEHPGNPDSPVGSLERKREARPEFERLRREVADLQRLLNEEEAE